MNVPFLDLKAQHRPLKEEILALWSGILDSAGFVGGEHVTAFEQEFAAACGAKHAVALASGTDALRFALIAHGLKPGDEVITVPNTFIATVEAISQAGGTSVFVDIDPATYNLDPAKIEAAITSRTKGIVPVHLYGQPADLDPIEAIARKHGLWVVEDAAQAQLAEYRGQKIGSRSNLAEFSFYPGKNLGACGEAGAVTTQDADIAARIRMLRDHGQSKKYHHEIEGYNGRCDALQAAALRVKLRHLSEWNKLRRAHAQRYIERLSGATGIALPATAPHCLPIWHLFVIQVDNRDAVQKALKERGIDSGLHYPVPLHLQNAYRSMGLGPGAFPVAEKCASRLLSLPMFPELTGGQIDYVCASLAEIVRQ
ncbi:MAG: DegT/DnrJ/EryC1/StrS family aminotransferase [Candidatus Hydrogenedentes bacterium]|nr:DegT/DnrJ/EryC1/StrS family aminotransferase [Candidatus Hydrogenedentota bacterium]